MADQPKRRELKFENLDEIVAEVEKLAAAEVTTTGNHTFTEIVEHLAITHDVTTGTLEGPKPPFFVRLMIPFIKRMVFSDKPAEPGFRLPENAEAFFWPKKEQTLEDAVDHLRKSVEIYKQQGPLEKHPAFGKVTEQQNTQLHVKHAALHLSFVHPKV